ncbi:hypothetical protein SDC9_210267 [bioreactor metagenome]|uniref:Uncharacterized protein n=1 Tax=bioreactor metagenome TaxID=1076179 RepID=A0A645JFN7_9ZZZZ
MVQLIGEQGSRGGRADLDGVGNHLTVIGFLGWVAPLVAAFPWIGRQDRHAQQDEGYRTEAAYDSVVHVHTFSYYIMDMH